MTLTAKAAFKAALARRVLWASYAAQLLLLTLTTWWLHQEGRQPSVTIWLIRVLPLLIFLPGLWRDNLRSVAWLCFVCLLYFMLAVTEAMSPFRLWINYLEVAVTVTLFVSAMLYIRWEAQRRRQKQRGEEQHGEKQAGEEQHDAGEDQG